MKHRIKANAGWYKGNPFKFVSVSIGKITDDYPTGWSVITFIEIQVCYFVIGIYLYNGRSQ